LLTNASKNQPKELHANTSAYFYADWLVRNLLKHLLT